MIYYNYHAPSSSPCVQPDHFCKQVSEKTQMVMGDESVQTERKQKKRQCNSANTQGRKNQKGQFIHDHVSKIRKVLKKLSKGVLQENKFNGHVIYCYRYLNIHYDYNQLLFYSLLILINTCYFIISHTHFTLNIIYHCNSKEPVKS